VTRSCDACGKSCRATHRFEQYGTEGSACCACMDCDDPNECAQEQNERSALNRARRAYFAANPDGKDRS
jgi:hypothetical protein